MTMTTAPSQPVSQPAYLRRDQAAAHIQNTYGFPCSRQWLAKLAVTGGGPAFRKASRFPLYDRADLDDWAKNRIGPRVQTTAKLSAIAADGGVR
jgi:hypothetical protein